jgi:DNA-binding NarL/FixJ family response regulator
MPELGLSVVVAEDLALVREGLISLISNNTPHKVVAQAADGESALAATIEFRPDILLIDLFVERMHALEVIHQLTLAGTSTRCVVMSLRGDRKTVLEALRGGAQGVLLKSSSPVHLYDCLTQVHEGGVYVSPEIDLQAIFAPDRTHRVDPFETLSSREYQVFSLLVDGIRAKEIAARLKLSPKTVDTYRASLMRKLDIHDVAGLVKFAIHKRLTSAHA